MQGSGFRVQGVGFRVQVSGFRVRGWHLQHDAAVGADQEVRGLGLAVSRVQGFGLTSRRLTVDALPPRPSHTVRLGGSPKSGINRLFQVLDF